MENKKNAQGDQVLIVAAEASSSLFAQRLIEQWKIDKPDLHCFGVGSNEMEQLGFERLGKSEEMAVVGAAEIIEHFGKLKGVFNSLVEQAKIRKPKLAVVMDYPEFNLMLSKKLHALGLPVVYYVSPQVWAWRKGRVETIKKYCKKVLVLFPFEVEFYKSKNVPVDFVGHPVLDELHEEYFDHNLTLLKRERCGIKKDEIVIGLMPGSRRGELKQHMGLQVEVARRLVAHNPKVKIAFLVAPSVDKENFKNQIVDVDFPFVLIKDDPFKMIALCDYILVASGTATLMVGLLEKPMVIMYKLKFLTSLFIRAFVHGVKYFGIVNLILGREVVPERWQESASVENLYNEMKRYLDEPEYTQKVRADLATLKSHLGDKGATKRVVKALEEFFV